jgi:3-oxoacyl-[acyl-carrier protein] reductase
VRLFTASGAKVAFSYQKARSQAETLAKECGEANCHAVASSLNDPDSARALVAEAVKHFGRIDILVANHGVWPAEDVAIEKMTDEQWRSTISINLDAVFGLVKHTVAQMKAQPRNGSVAGHIVLISSTSGQRGEAFHCDYSATKGALISMVKGLSTELASSGIYVNSVAPGWVDTDMSSARARRPAKRRRNSPHHPSGPRRHAPGDCRPGAVSLHRIRQLHHRRGLQRKRRRRSRGIAAHRNSGRSVTASDSNSFSASNPKLRGSTHCAPQLRNSAASSYNFLFGAPPLKRTGCMKHLLLIAALAFALAACVPSVPFAAAQAAHRLLRICCRNQVPQFPLDQENAHKARELLDQAIQALGGQAYLERSRYAGAGPHLQLLSRTPSSNGVFFWRFLEYPDKERIELTPQRDIAYIYTGDKGYEVTYKGPRAVEKKDLEDYLRHRRFSLETILRSG